MIIAVDNSLQDNKARIPQGSVINLKIPTEVNLLLTQNTGYLANWGAADSDKLPQKSGGLVLRCELNTSGLVLIK